MSALQMENFGQVNFQMVKKVKHVILVNIKTNPQNWDKSNKSQNHAINLISSSQDTRRVFYPTTQGEFLLLGYMIEKYYTKIPGKIIHNWWMSAYFGKKKLYT